MKHPEGAARKNIDAALDAAGWLVQDYETLNVSAGRGVAVREFPLPGFGSADYMLYVDGEAVGIMEAKKEGTTLTGIEVQAEKYAVGIPADLPAPIRPLPFLYQSTGIETRFTNRLEPDARSRTVFHVHRPATLAEWLARDPVYLPLANGKPDPLSERPASLRLRLRTFPSLEGRTSGRRRSSRPQPRAVARRRPAARADPDGDRVAARPSPPSTSSIA